MGKSMRERLVQKKYVILFVLIIIAQIAVMAYYENSKQFYHIDEIYSFESAHNVMLYSHDEEGFRIYNQDKWYNQWHSKEEFMEHFEVQGDQSLLNHSIKEIVTGRKSGILYECALNIMCSLLGKTEPNKWSGFILNCILFFILQVMIFKMAYYIMQTKAGAMVAVILFGFSAGAISLVLYVRFYYLCLLSAAFISYFHLRLWNCKKNWQMIIYLAGVAIAGVAVYSCQPYIMTYLGSTIIAFILMGILSKKYKLILKYVALLVAGTVCVGIVRFEIFLNVLSMANSDFGQSAIEGLLHRQWEKNYEYMKYFFLKLLSHVGAGIIGTVVILILLLTIFFSTRIKRDIKKHIEFQNAEMVGILIATAVIFFLLQCRLLEAMAYRYMSYYYPIISVLFASGIVFVLQNSALKKRYVCFFIAIIVVLQLGFGYSKQYVDEIYPEAREMKEILAGYQECDSVLFIEARHAHQYYRDGFLVPDGTDFCAVESLDALKMDYDFMDRENGRPILCWFPKFDWNNEEDDYRALDRIVNVTQYSSYFKILETYQSTVYYLY